MPIELGVAAVIAAFACVQSVFGMGVLVFGTPTLLLLGFGFVETLGFLLPSSLAISVMQLLHHTGTRPPISPNLYVICLPAIVVTLWLFVEAGGTDYARVAVGGALVATAVVRTVPALRIPLENLVLRRSTIYHLLMGILHGATNLGGSMLAVLAATLHEDKRNLRLTVARYYLAFGAIQCMTIVLHGDSSAVLSGVRLIPIAIAAYLLFGIAVFKRLTDVAYGHSMNVFILVYGVALFVQPVL